MGLKLHPLGRAKPGHETEWQELLSMLCADEAVLAASEQAHLKSISVPAYQTLGAPTVGFDKTADAWALANKRVDDPRSDVEYMKAMKGYHVVALLQGQCDGVPEPFSPSQTCSEATIFDGSALDNCTRILDKATLGLARRHIIAPEEAVAFGQHLLQTGTQNTPLVTPIRPNIFGRLFSRKRVELTLPEQRQIAAKAGKWYIFWGVRGHPIWAND